MKTNYLFIAILQSATLLTSCVQPYSSKSFYKAQHTANTPSNAPDPAGTLSYNDIIAVSKISPPSEREISKALRKLNPHWRIKGFERATGTIFFFNFWSKNDEETFIWHSKENTAEYVTTNTNHYIGIINDFKSKGYKPAGIPAASDEQYANGEKIISVSRVGIFDGNAGYKFAF